MDDNKQQAGEQGFDRDQELTTSQQPAEQRPNAQPIGGNDSGSGTGTTMTSGSSTGDTESLETGQASYGNSGETSASDNADTGLAGDQSASGFIGANSSASDMGSASQGMTQTDDAATTSSLKQDGSSQQDFAAQGQGAIDSETMMGKAQSDQDEGTDDIEVERGEDRGSNMQ